ncbi:fructose-6-phosphate aldolase [Bombilactobacillus folatiphilus]|uniref:Fructose-6-phosphate aldolase n=1 Tax=Bombilactobacillus folatiphilus TaxID=2923362 RepID=A0ABY4P8P1_9LACO|nr:fructose-6-phosphate aldolase [Bombilactobacillus folatiphilus]UQS81906.1 fructose-6-phosphate aldolase [Bombilactobacillus folatiphilus]
MEFLLDTSDLQAIQKYSTIIPLSGVTTNPSIIKKGGKVDFFARMKQIKQMLGPERTFHIQVVGTTTAEMVADAQTIRQEIGADVYVKVPTTAAGLAAMQILKADGFGITATAIYTEFQGFLATAAGADYLAPYYNRMVNMNINADQVIADMAQQIKQCGAKTKILAASFHTVQQVNAALVHGAQAVTMGPEILDTGLGVSAISAAVNDFTKDWQSIYGNTTIATL